MVEEKLRKVTVFIPAFNEEESIASVIDKVRELYTKDITQSKGYFVEILVVNDGSTDKTEEIAKSRGVKIVSHLRNLGLGGAVRTALQTAYAMGTDIAVKIDADLQYDPADIEKVISPLLEDKADICWGSRFAGDITFKMPFIRYVGNKFFTWLLNILTDYKISDAQSGLKAFGRRYLAIFEIHGNYNSNQQILLDANFKHMRYAEVPITFIPRSSGESFVNLKYPFKVILNIIRVLVYANPLKVFGTIGITMIFFSLLQIFLWWIGNLIEYNILEKVPILGLKNLALLLFLAGVQTLFFGILADLIVKRRK